MRYILLSFGLVILGTVATGQSAKQCLKAGNEFMKIGNFTDAVVQYTQVISMDPNNSDAYVGRADALSHLEKYQEAAEDYIRASAFVPKEIQIVINVGIMYFNLLRDEDALSWMNRALSMRRDNMDALQYKIRILTRLGRFQDAAPVCEVALVNKESAENLYLAGIVKENLGKFEQAESDLQHAISKEKETTKARIALANVHLKMNKTDEALTDINAALKLEPNNIEAYLTRAGIYVKKLDYPSAINDLSKSILINPNDDKLYLIRGSYYQEFTQYQNAIYDYNKVLLINPKNAEAFYKRASANEEIANYKGAVKDYESLIDLSEFDVKAKKLLIEAKNRLFELNRESVKPELKLMNPPVGENNIINLPLNKTELSIIGEVSDQSDIMALKINGTTLSGPFTRHNNIYEFITSFPLNNDSSFSVTITDIYNNTLEEKFLIRRTEIIPPKISLVAPFSSDDGYIYLDNSETSIYVEGTASDESLIKSISIDGVSASYASKEYNPEFTVNNLGVNNKTQITVTATDIYGNISEVIYKINREASEIAAENPMGKTWAVFIENSKYQVFASLEGPPKDITMMKSALTKYNINNVIHKRDMSKKEMERFFAIELRDLLRSNRVNSLMVWYSGHGKFINETGYWIPIDAARDDEFTYYNINALRAAMQSYSSLTHTLVVTDACESGPTFYQAMRSVPTIKSCTDWQATKFKSSQVFSSAGYELAIDNSQFTKTFANTLANNPDACVPIELIVNKVTLAVSQSNNQQKPQFGKIAGLSDENGSFFFMVKEQGK
jgi:tetratricopeptide (TPR) repeat protein